MPVPGYPARRPAGIPSVRAFTGGDAVARAVFSGWELPTADQLEARVLAVLDSISRAGASDDSL